MTEKEYSAVWRIINRLMNQEKYVLIISFYSKDGRSALLVACINGHFDIVKLLVDKNANIFLKNNVKCM